MRALALVLLLALAAPAASAAPPPKPLPPLPHPDPAIVNGSAQRALDRARRHWHAAGIHDYRFTVNIAACCSRVPQLVFFVRDGRPAQKVPSTWRGLATVTRLQKVVQDAIDFGAESLSVRYDKRGVPRRIAIDPFERAADDDAVYRVDHFWRGTRGRGGPSMP
jgi:hypothetical protein